MLLSCTWKLRWFAIIIVGIRLYFVILVALFRWKRIFPSKEAKDTKNFYA